MENLMDRFFRGGEGWFSGEGFSPAVNVAETPQAYEVTADLPGMKAEDLDLEMKEGQLWISGQREEQTKEEGKTFHRIERTYGKFHRVVPLPGSVDEAGIEAEYRDGVLSIRVPKSAEVQPKKIQVRSAPAE